MTLNSSSLPSRCVVSRTGRTSTKEPGRNARMPLTSTVKPPLTLPLITPLTTSSAAKAASRTIQHSDRKNVDQRTWQERTDAVNVDSEAAFNLTVDNALDHFFSCEGCFENNPAFSALGFFTGQLGFTETVFNRVQSNVNFVTDIDSQVTSIVVELFQRDQSFRLQTSVNGYPASLVIDINDNTGDDGACLKVQGF